MNVIEMLRELLFNLISLTNAKHIRGRAKYNRIGRLINEIEDLVMFHNLGEDKDTAIAMIEECSETLKTGGYRLNNALNLCEVTLTGETYKRNRPQE
tara:strand:- start:166 stop:456 length:291 start_codon:yes stop_codon:yes gene_type:complete